MVYVYISDTPCADEVLKAAEGSPHAALTSKNKFTDPRFLHEPCPCGHRGGARAACAG